MALFRRAKPITTSARRTREPDLDFPLLTSTACQPPTTPPTHWTRADRVPTPSRYPPACHCRHAIDLSGLPPLPPLPPLPRRIRPPRLPFRAALLLPTTPLPSMALHTLDESSAPSSPLSSVPSSPLSSPPSSPEPPMGFAPRLHRAPPYPSPPASQQTSHSGSPTPDGMDSATNSDKDGPSPKRRKISRDPKHRTTEYLDLLSGEVEASQQDELDRLLRVLHKRQKVVVIAGAGISVSAGSKYRSSAQSRPTCSRARSSPRLSLPRRTLPHAEGGAQDQRLGKGPLRCVGVQGRHHHLHVP